MSRLHLRYESACETIDRREKLLAYQKLESLHEYALIATGRRRVQVYRRYGGQWMLAMYEDDDLVMLDSVHYHFELDVLFEGVPDELWQECVTGRPASRANRSRFF